MGSVTTNRRRDGCGRVDGDRKRPHQPELRAKLWQGGKEESNKSGVLEQRAFWEMAERGGDRGRLKSVIKRNHHA